MHYSKKWRISRAIGRNKVRRRGISLRTLQYKLKETRQEGNAAAN